MRRPLAGLTWDNSYARLPAAFHTRLQPTPLPDPYLVAFNPDGAALLGLDPDEAARPGFLDAFAGNAPLPGSEPLAAIYAGHQFGVFVPQLGDGRAHPARRGDRPARPLGRAAQGRGAHALLAHGRRTRGAALVDPRIPLLRGHARPRHPDHARAVPSSAPTRRCIRETVETAAVVTRLAPSHVRFGSFELFDSAASTTTSRTPRRLRHREHFPHLAGAAGALRGLARRGRRAHRAADRAVAGGGLLPRRDEHRQHVHPRAHHRLRAVRLPRRLRLGLRLQPLRRRRPLRVRHAAAHRALEPRLPGAVAAVADAAGGRRSRAGPLRPGVQRRLRRRDARASWDSRSRTTTTRRSSATCSA